MEQYDSQNNKKTSKMEKVVKHALFIFPLLLNNSSLSELSGLEQADERFAKSKYGHFKIFDFRLMFFIKNLKEILGES